MEFSEEEPVEVIEEQTTQLNEMLSDYLPIPEESAIVEELSDGQKSEEVEEVAAAPEAEEVPPVEDTKGPEGEVAEEPVVEPAPVEMSEMDIIRQQNEVLMKRIEELSEKMITPQKVEDAKETLSDATIVDLIGEDDIDDILASKELFNKTIAKAMQIAEERAIQRVLVSIPNIVMRQTNQQAAIKEATDNFYRNNPDLEPMKKTVAAVANEIYSTNPQLSIQEIFDKSAEKTREILGIRNKVMQGNINEKGRSPEVVGTTRGGRNKSSAPSLDKMQQELSELLNF